MKVYWHKQFNNMNVSKIATLIGNSKMNKGQIALQCGVSRTTIENLLSGADIKVSTLESLSKVLGVSPAVFFDNLTEINGSVAVKNNSGTITTGDINADGNAVLTERIKLLEKLLDEKERMIQLLLSRDK